MQYLPVQKKSPEPRTPVKSAGEPRATKTKQAVEGVEGFEAQEATLTPATTDRSAPPVQKKGGGDSANVHQAAQQGIQGGGGALPHLAAIQESFGSHDVSNVQAHTGAQARRANEQMGAEAYATGDHVAFGKSPDLHTAAHEAAHVVQQRSGVSLSGGVGEKGDPYERHADQVADAVVSGKSAQGLLDSMSGKGGGGGTQHKVQRKAASTKDEITSVQNKLNELGFDCGKADGLMGPKTRGALKAFQKSRGLSQSGTPDAATVAALEGGAGPARTGPEGGVPSQGQPAGPAAGTPTPASQAGPATTPGPRTEGAGASQPTQAGPAPSGASEEQMSEADRLRASIAGKANEWNGKEFMSQQEIESVREKSGLKNYTTCIDFAGKMMREGSRDAYGKDFKKAQQTAMMLVQVKADWEKGVGQNIQAAAMQKAVERFDKLIAETEARKAKIVSEIEDLRRPKGEGESDLAVKQRNIRANALENSTVKAIDSQIRQLQAQRASFQKKVDSHHEKAKAIDAKNTAMIKAADGMTNGRPKEGEYIILSQAPGGGNYGVSKETQVHLAAGSFKHIAIFMGIEKEDDGSGVETWRTIDGGGTKGKTTFLFVRKADRMVFPAYHGAKAPEAGSASKSQIAGWIDMAELIKMRDEKAAGQRK